MRGRQKRKLRQLRREAQRKAGRQIEREATRCRAVEEDVPGYDRSQSQEEGDVQEVARRILRRLVAAEEDHEGP